MDHVQTSGIGALIAQVGAAVAHDDPLAITNGIKDRLSSMILSRELALPARFRVPRPDCYARRLLHRDAALGYTLVVMTWGPGQGTPLHDHAGLWCVEAVVEGEMEVTQYDLLEQRGALCRFGRRSSVLAGVGSSGCLIPPWEYHVLQNRFPDRPSITLHVYGGEMDRCCAFEPRANGWYERVERVLSYHD